MGEGNERDTSPLEADVGRLSLTDILESDPSNTPPNLPPLPSARPRPPKAPLPARSTAAPPVPPPRTTGREDAPSLPPVLGVRSGPPSNPPPRPLASVPPSVPPVRGVVARVPPSVPPVRPSAPVVISKPPSAPVQAATPRASGAPKPLPPRRPPPSNESVEIDFDELGVAPVAATLPPASLAATTLVPPRGDAFEWKRLIPWLIAAAAVGVATFVILRRPQPPATVILDPVQVGAQPTTPANRASIAPVSPPPEQQGAADTQEPARRNTANRPANRPATAATNNATPDPGEDEEYDEEDEEYDEEDEEYEEDETPVSAMIQPTVRPSTASLPDVPERDAVQRAMLSVRAAVRECMDRGGRVPVRVTIIGRTGRITTAQVEDAYFARQPTGSCIARAVRRAQFPRFSRERLVVVYPYDF